MSDTSAGHELVSVCVTSAGLDVISLVRIFLSRYQAFLPRLTKPLTAFGKIFVRRSSTRFGFYIGVRGVIGPICTYFKLNSSSVGSLSSYY